MNAQSAARVATVGFLAIMAFQLLLALGLPLGRGAYGGQNEGAVPMDLRVSSVVALVIYAVSIFTVRTRAGLTKRSPDSRFAKYGTWFFAGFLLFGAVLNAASSSPWERFLWAPFALILSWLCFVVARRK